MARTLWDRLADVENTIRARKGQPPINALVGAPYINAARERAVAALAQSAPALAKLICDGPAKFTAVGPGQARRGTGYARDEENRKPQVGEVAIADPKRFGLTRQQLRDGADVQIKIYPHGLDQVLKETGGPTPPFTVGDIGSPDIRNYAGNWFDIYRFGTMKGAKEFGPHTVETTMEIPALPGAHCPPGMTLRK